MRRHAKGLIGASFLVLAVCFLCAMSCSWDIVTTGEILKGEDSSIEDLQTVEAVRTAAPAELLTDEHIPDSLVFIVFSTISIDGETFDFVEMEVGELLDGDGNENDTLLVDHRP